MKAKRLLLSLLIGFFCITHANAQKPAEDIIYLRDGSILKGTIVQITPDRPVQVVTSDGRTFILKRSEILRFTHAALVNHEEIGQRSWAPGYLAFKLGYIYSPDYGASGASLSLDFGYLLTDNIGISSRSTLSLLDKYKDEREMKALAMKVHVGPLFSFRTSRRGSVDITPMAGIGRLHYYEKGRGWQRESTPIRFSWEVGTQYRHRIGRRMDLLTGINYSYTHGHDEISAGVGIAFKLD